MNQKNQAQTDPTRELERCQQEIRDLKAKLLLSEEESRGLEEQARLYKLLADNVRDVIWTMDLDLHYTYVSPSIRKLMGFDTEEAMAIQFKDSLTAESAEIARQKLVGAMEREARHDPEPEQAEPFELQLLGKNGKKIDIEVISTFLRDDEGKPTGILGVSRDVTERKKARADIQMWAQVFENAHWGIALVEKDNGHFTLVNEAYSTMHGYTVEELIGKPNSIVYPRKSMEHRGNQLRLAFKKGRHSYETQHVRSDGSIFPVRVDATAVRGNDGEIVFWAVNVVDLTEQKRGEQALRMASRMEATATLAGGIAHDFNNLMVGVMGNASLIGMKLGGDHMCADMLNEISDAAEQAGSLSQQLVAFARGGNYQPKVVNLNDSLESILELQTRIFPRRIEVVRDPDPELWNVNADPTQMGQVIMNLCINAVEAMEGMGRITIATRNVVVDQKFATDRPGLEAGKFVYLTVSDTGQGMSHETRSKVFEPFFSTKAQGRGLGLAAAYGIVKNHNGAIYVENAADHGTTISIYIPATEKEIEKEDVANTDIAEGSETVLVIDDEPMVLTVTQQLLEHFGYDVICAKNGREAVDIAESHSGDIGVALLDMGMPIMGGAEAFPLLAQARPSMKIIICSGYELAGASQTLLDSGASAFVQKPFLPQDLCSEIRKALDS